MSWLPQLPPPKPLQKYSLLGNSGLKVSPVCLGAMNFGTAWGERLGEVTKEQAVAILDKYISEGGNFFDTAPNYQNGQSEEWLGEYFEERGIRDDVVIATKYTGCTKFGSINNAGNSRRNMFVSIEGSLRRLRTHYIDVFYLHFWDFTTPVEEIMRALNDLVSQGKVHYLGISDTPAWRVAQMNTYARSRGWAEFVCYQGRYHFGERDFERDIVPMSNEFKMALIPWGIVGQGKYTGRFKKGEEPQGGARKNVNMTDKDYEIARVVAEVADETGRSQAQVCLAYMLSLPNFFPLIGCRTLEQLEDNIQGLTLTLTSEQIDRIKQVATLDLGFPHNFIGQSIETCNWTKVAGTIVERK